MGRLLSKNQSVLCSVPRRLPHLYIPALQEFHNGHLEQYNLLFLVRENAAELMHVLTEACDTDWDSDANS